MRDPPPSPRRALVQWLADKGACCVRVLHVGAARLDTPSLRHHRSYHAPILNVTVVKVLVLPPDATAQDIVVWLKLVVGALAVDVVVSEAENAVADALEQSRDSQHKRRRTSNGGSVPAAVRRAREKLREVREETKARAAHVGDLYAVAAGTEMPINSLLTHVVAPEPALPRDAAGYEATVAAFQERYGVRLVGVRVTTRRSG